MPDNLKVMPKWCLIHSQNGPRQCQKGARQSQNDPRKCQIWYQTILKWYQDSPQNGTKYIPKIVSNSAKRVPAHSRYGANVLLNLSPSKSSDFPKKRELLESYDSPGGEGGGVELRDSCFCFFVTSFWVFRFLCARENGR